MDCRDRTLPLTRDELAEKQRYHEDRKNHGKKKANRWRKEREKRAVAEERHRDAMLYGAHPIPH